MFAHLTSHTPTRAAETVVGITTVVRGRNPNPRAVEYSVIYVRNRTAGSVMVSAQGSFDGLTWFALPDTVNATGNGIFYLQFSEAVPPYLRYVLVDAAGFDGTLAITEASSGGLGIAGIAP